MKTNHANNLFVNYLIIQNDSISINFLESVIQQVANSQYSPVVTLAVNNLNAIRLVGSLSLFSYSCGHVEDEPFPCIQLLHQTMKLQYHQPPQNNHSRQTNSRSKSPAKIVVTR